MNLDRTPVDVATKGMIGITLAWAVGHALNLPLRITYDPVSDVLELFEVRDCKLLPFSPQDDWSQCGPLVDEYQVSLGCSNHGLAASGAPMRSWAQLNGRSEVMGGDTTPEAVCRAVVQALSGDIVKVPAFLVLPS